MKFNWKETKWGSYTFAIIVGVVLYVILEHFGTVLNSVSHFLGYFKPVIIGLVIAYIVDLVNKALKKYILRGMKNKKLQNNVSVALSIVLIILCLSIIGYLFIPQVVKSINNFVNNLGMYVNSFDASLDSLTLLASQFDIDLNFESVSNFVAENISYLTNNAGNIASTLSSVGSGFVLVLISCFIAVYCLLAKEFLQSCAQRVFRLIIPEKTFPTVAAVYKKCDIIFSKYIICSLLEALFVGIANAVFMAICGMQYIPIISVIVGVTNLAPTFGPILGCIIGAVILVLVNPIDALIFILFTLVLQMIDGYVIKPKLFGEALNVPSIWILISIVVFGRMLGVVGILLAIPLAAILCYLIGLLMDYLEKRKMDLEQEEEAEV